jgi:hypothetical protein
MSDELPLGDVLRGLVKEARAVADQQRDETERARYNGLADGLDRAADKLAAVVEQNSATRFHYGPTFGETSRGTARR